ncbi:MAG: hypothetical protein LUC23_05670 [Prevotellaceae bacterium]|nr:hypothetical protein [Prevotellaceae bacterium]
MGKSDLYTEEESCRTTGGDTGALPARTSPSFINELAPGEVFVFGSNAQGMHGGGAALTAYLKFGAVWGNGEGLQGQSYAIPTMEGLDSTRQAVGRFTTFARDHSELKFLVTAVGCGIAGYRLEEIAPMFCDAARLDNVYLPAGFWKVLRRM